MLSTGNNNGQKKEPSFAGKLFLTLFLSIFLVMGISFFLLMSSMLYKEASSYLWNKADCTIKASGIQEDNKSGHASYTFKVVYDYTVNGVEYNSERVSLQYNGSGKYNDTQELLIRFPSCSKRSCYVNPSNPSEAFLIHNPSILLMLPFMAIPLIFIIIGGGGIYVVWRRKDLSDNSSLKRPETGKKFLPLFFSLFLIVGLVTFYAIGIRPTVKSIQSEKWLKTPCRIISSSVGSHSDNEGGTTYSVDILYSYVINGREYRSNNYGFMGGSSSGYKGKQKIVSNYPPEMQTVCHVNPENPADAVLNRNLTADMLFGLFPLLFVIVGAGGLYYTLKKKGNSDASTYEYDNRSLSDYSEGDCELKPIEGPLGSFLGGLLLNFIWNGILSIFVYIAVQSWLKGHPEWFLTILLTPFTIVGVFLLYGTIVCFIAIFNPRPKLKVNSKSICAGSKLKVQWEINEKSAEVFRKLKINLKCFKGDMKDRNSKGNILQEYPIVETEDTFKMISGSKDIIIPENAHPSSGENKINWIITLRGTLRSRPKLEMEYRIQVLAKRK